MTPSNTEAVIKAWAETIVLQDDGYMALVLPPYRDVLARTLSSAEFCDVLKPLMSLLMHHELSKDVLKDGRTAHIITCLMDFFSSPTSFEAGRPRWLLFWAVVAACHEVLRTISRQGSQEPTHNGGIIALIQTHISFLNTLELLAGVKPTLDPLVVRDFAIGDTEKKTGADFAIAAPTGQGTMKLALFQAKRRHKNGRISLAQRTGRALQLQVLCHFENRLRAYAGRGKADPRRPVLDAIAYYVTWDRAEAPEPGVIVTPTVRGALQLKREWLAKKKPVKNPTADPFRDAMDFASLVALCLPNPGNDVGVEFGLAGMAARPAYSLRGEIEIPEDFTEVGRLLVIAADKGREEIDRVVEAVHQLFPDLLEVPRRPDTGLDVR